MQIFNRKKNTEKKWTQYEINDDDLIKIRRLLSVNRMENLKELKQNTTKDSEVSLMNKIADTEKMIFKIGMFLEDEQEYQHETCLNYQYLSKGAE